MAFIAARVYLLRSIARPAAQRGLKTTSVAQPARTGSHYHIYHIQANLFLALPPGYQSQHLFSLHSFSSTNQLLCFGHVTNVGYERVMRLQGTFRFALLELRRQGEEDCFWHQISDFCQNLIVICWCKCVNDHFR